MHYECIKLLRAGSYIKKNTNSCILHSLCTVFVHYIHTCDYGRDPCIRILIMLVCIRAIVYLYACSCACEHVIGIAWIASEDTRMEHE